MTRLQIRAVSVAVLLVLFFMLLLLLRGSPASTIPSPTPPGGDHIMQAIYRLEVEALDDGWTSERARSAGDLWRRAGDLTRAVAYWERADAAADLLRDLSEAYIELGAWAKASDALQGLIGAAPDDAWARFQIGIIRAAADPQGALPHLLAAAREPGYAQPLAGVIAAAETGDPLRIGVALADADLWAYAELAFESAGGDPLAYAYGGFARDRQGKDGGAWIRQAVALAPDDPQVRLLEGLHLRSAGDVDASLAAVVRAAALDPDNPAVFAELGQAYALVGDRDAAERWLTYAVSLSDGDPAYEAILNRFLDEGEAFLLELGITDEAAATSDPSPAPLE